MIKIPIVKLRDEPLRLDLNVAPSEMDLNDTEYHFEGKVTGEIDFRLIDQDVEAQGEIRAKAQARCVRCLEPAAFDLRVPVQEYWFWRGNDPEPGAKPEDEQFAEESAETSFYFGDTIEPAEKLREVLMAELPDLPKCSDGCKGLCSGCGANLNKEKCRCEKVEVSPEPPEGSNWKEALRGIHLE